MRKALKETSHSLAETNSGRDAGDNLINCPNAAEEKRFFHWELEFPEVFFAPSKPGGQDVQLREDSGFDVVMGNPPYSDIKGLEGDFHPLFV